MTKLLTALAIVASTTSVSAFASSPVMFSTLNGFNAPSSDAVGGVRLAVLHGKVQQVKGVDIALVAMSETDTTVGLNVGAIFGGSKVNQSMTGVSLGWFNWMPGKTTGLNMGTVNVTGDVKGANLALVNYSEGDTVFDWAAVSISKSSTVQLGIFNMTDNIKGVQIGLLNCADNGFFKCFPFVNWAK
jgi:hypothetical protein